MVQRVECRWVGTSRPPEKSAPLRFDGLFDLPSGEMSRSVHAPVPQREKAEVEDDKGTWDMVDVAVTLEVEEESGALTGALDADADKDGLERAGAVSFDGAREALRVRPMAEAGAFVAGAVFVRLEVGAPELTDFLSAEVADATLFTTEVAASVATLVAGAFLTLPTPKVPDLRIYD